MNDDLAYDGVIERAEPYDEDRPSNPLEVYVREREQRRRFNGIGDPPVSHQFFVVDHAHERVAHVGRWTTPDSHHNIYEEAKGRAFGVVHGYAYARREHKRLEGELEPEEDEFVYPADEQR